MKKSIILIGVLIGLFSACAGSYSVEVGQKTSIDVQRVYDAGTVLQGEIIEAEILITNTGNYPLIIGEVKPSCSCTVVDKPEEPIQPGEDGVIKAKVETKNASIGLLSKSVRIVTNTEPSVNEVVIRATIK
jgi:hypothetical protein